MMSKDVHTRNFKIFNCLSVDIHKSKILIMYE